MAAAITGQRGSASSVEHDMFTAAVFEEKALGIYWFSVEESCGEKKIRPHTITSENSFVVGTGKWETEKEKRRGSDA